MKTLNSYYFVLLALLFATSCEDNYIIEGEEEVTISEPTEVESTEVSGRVLDINNVALSNADVIYRHNDILKTIQCDDSGNYSFELPKDESRIYIQVHSDNYITSGVDAIVLDSDKKEKNIKLLTAEEVGYEGEMGLLNKSTNSTISGQVLFQNGNPAPDIKIILLELSTLTFVSYVVTDTNGQYTIASESFDNYLLFALSDCGAPELIIEDISLADQDLELGTYQSTYSEIDQFTVSGTVLNCNSGEGVITGSVEIRFDGNSDAYYGDIVDGEYSVVVDNCISATCFNVRVSSPVFSELLEVSCEEITGTNMEANYTLCGEETTVEGEIRLLVGSDSLIYNNAVVQFDESTGAWLFVGFKEDLANAFLAVINSMDVGTYNPQVIQIADDTLGVLQNYAGSGIPFEIEVIESGDYIIGTISGELFDEDGVLYPITGTYNIKLQ